eukprot:gene10344-11454_t
MSVASDVSVASSLSKVILTPLNQNIKVGIIGNTNVGKSLLFNLLTSRRESRAAEVANALFTTIDPNIAIYEPASPHIEVFKDIHPTCQDIIAGRFTVIDTAGLIEHSFLEAAGVGVGSFKAVAYADILIILLRCFEGTEITHYLETIDPLRDFKMIEQELLQMDLNRVETVLSELESVLAAAPMSEALTYQQETLVKFWEFLAGTKRPTPLPPRRRKGMKTMSINRVTLPELCQGLPIRLGHWDNQQREILQFCNLLTAKQVIVLQNLSAIDYLSHRLPCGGEVIQPFLSSRGDDSPVLPISLDLEQRLSRLAATAGQLEVYQAVNGSDLHHSALPALLEEVYRTLHLVRWYTVSDEKIRLWLSRHGTTAVEASSLQHVTIARYFLRAEVISFDDYKEFEGDRVKLALEGKIHSQGRKYVFNDGDIVTFSYKQQQQIQQQT